MKAYIIAILFLFAQTLFAKTLVISDIDDTLRMSNIHAGIFQKAGNTTDPSLVFSGMPEILRALDQNQAVIYYVTGSVAPFDQLGRDFLEYNQFPQRDHFANKGWFEDTKEFKASTIHLLVEQEQPDKIILLGDNGEQDEYAYQEILEAYPLVFPFIHKVYNEGSPIAADQSLFISGADLSLQLYAQGHITTEQTVAVIETVFSALQTEPDLVVADWAEFTLQDVDRAFSSQSQFSEKKNEVAGIKNFILQRAQ